MQQSLTAREASYSKRLSRSNRVPEGAELPSALFTTCAGERVEWIRQLDIDESRASDDRLPPCARQGAGDSTGPQVNVAEGFLRNRALQADIGHCHPAARLQHPEDLPVDTDLVRT